VSRILLITWGSFGDLYPYLGLAVHLKALGHQPVLATCPVHQPVVERAGIEFRPLRPDVNPEDTDLMRRIMDARRGTEVIVREILVPAMRQQHADISEAAEGADVLVTHPVTFAAPIVAEESRRPWLSAVLAPISFFSRTDFPALPGAPGVVPLSRLGPWAARGLKRIAESVTRGWTAPVRALRAERGLPPAADPLYDGQFSPYGTLALFSPVFGAPQPDWPVRTHATGFVFYNGPGAALPPAVEEFLDAGDPPIVFTLGSSAFGAAGRFYEESARAAVRLGRRAVLLAGPKPENRLAAPAAGVCVVESAPHELVFPRAAAIVHHGGVGTTGQALRSGRPMVVVPFAHDQPDNANRVRERGVARVIPPRRYRAARVAAELEALLMDRRAGERADALGRAVRAERGTEAAADLILRACGARTPADFAGRVR
jgi:UDP:flavonoid glycosyltransferase YjiC (YdhE family)